MHRPTTFKTFGPMKGSFWTPKLQKIKWEMISGTPCTCSKDLKLGTHLGRVNWNIF